MWIGLQDMAPRILLGLGLVLLAAQSSLAFIIAPGAPRPITRALAAGPQTTIEGAGPAKTDAVDVKLESSTIDVKGGSEGVTEGPCPGFPKCDGAYKGKGCVNGKIQGGLGTVPGLGWWPIKAYRPCPSASEAGYGYKRKGPDFGEFLAGERRSATEQKEATKSKSKKKKSNE